MLVRCYKLAAKSLLCKELTNSKANYFILLYLFAYLYISLYTKVYGVKMCTSKTNILPQNYKISIDCNGRIKQINMTELSDRIKILLRKKADEANLGINLYKCGSSC